MVGGGRAWLAGGVHGCQGACMVGRGACLVAGGPAWLPGGMHGCQGGWHAWLLGGMCGCRGACVVAGGHAWLLGGVHGCLGGHGCQGVCVVAGGCIPCDLSHHAFDVTCMLPPHQLRLITSAAAYIVFGHVTTHAPPPWTE